MGVNNISVAAINFPSDRRNVMFSMLVIVWFFFLCCLPFILMVVNDCMSDENRSIDMEYIISESKRANLFIFPVCSRDFEVQSD